MSSTLADTAPGEATVLGAVGAFIDQELPRFPVPRSTVAERQSGEAAPEGLYTFAEERGQRSVVGIREAKRLVGALEVTKLDRGWIVSGYQLCNTLLTRSLR